MLKLFWPMSTENSVSTVAETVTEKTVHPVKQFLEACGADVSTFPVLKFVVETQEKVFNNTQVYIPLRVPGRSGFVYESFCRISRVTEIPEAQSEKLRKFIEIEWRIDENPLLEAEHHAVFSFMSGEVECPACRALFIPDAQIVDDVSVRVTCPNCLHYWTLKVDSPALDSPTLVLLTDAFYKSPTTVRQNIETWTSSFSKENAGDFQRFFPCEFNDWDKDSSLDWFFGDERGFTKKNAVEGGDFELISKSFINHLSLKYFKENEQHLSSNLDKTEVHRKSEIQQKQEEAQRRVVSEFLAGASEEPENESTQNSEAAIEQPTQDSLKPGVELTIQQPYEVFSEMTQPAKFERQFEAPDTVVKDLSFDIYSPGASKPKTLSAHAIGIGVSLVASLLLIGGIFGYFVYQKKSTQQELMTKFEEQQAIANKADEERAAEQAQADSDTSSGGGKVVDQMLSKKDDRVVDPKESSTEGASVKYAAFKPGTEAVDNESESLAVEEKLEEEVQKDLAESVNTEEKVAEEVEVKVTKEETAKEKVVVEPEGMAKPNLARMALIDAGFRQGMLHLKLQESKKAISEFNKVIELDPNHLGAHRHLGIAFVQEGQFSKALTAFETWMGLQKSDQNTSVSAKDTQNVQHMIQMLREKVQN